MLFLEKSHIGRSSSRLKKVTVNGARGREGWERVYEADAELLSPFSNQGGDTSGDALAADEVDELGFLSQRGEGGQAL